MAAGCDQVKRGSRMSGTKISKESRRIIETVIFRYPRKKIEYETYLQEGGSRPTKWTAETEKELQAVEVSYQALKPEEQEVIVARYWIKGIEKPVPYIRIASGYSERQMKRIVAKMVLFAGKELGELQ